MKIQSKIFVITGAGSGIGRELVLEILARGGDVAAVDLKDKGLHETQEIANVEGNKLSIHVLDIADKNAVEQLPDKVVSIHGKVDGVINCAGIIQPFVRVNDLNYEVIERVMNVNFFGTLYMTKAFLPYLLKRTQAQLVNVSSMGGFLPVPGQSIYGASKAAVKLMTEGLYAELLDTPVNVMIVYPGATDTNIVQNSSVNFSASNSSGKENFKANVLPADTVAKIIIDGIESNKPQVFTGKDSKSMNRLYRLNPVFATKFIAKQMKSLLE